MNPNAWLSQITPRLNHLWRGSWKTGATEPGRYLYDHELVVVTRGACQVQVDEAFYELTAGTFLIIAPGTYHATIVHRGGVHRTCFHFDWTGPLAKRTRLPLWTYHPNRPSATEIRKAPSIVPKRPWTGHFELAGHVPALIETIFHRRQMGSEQERATCHAVFTEVLIGLLWKKSQQRPPQNRATQLAYSIKELLDTIPPGSVAIQPLLASLGFSYEHLCRLFKAKFGISPIRYRNAARIERARNLLRDPKRTIADAAYQVGFDDPAYFSRKFRQRYGMAPSRARLR